jgi:hypothetical protein
LQLPLQLALHHGWQWQNAWSQADQLFHGFKNHQDSAHNVSKAIINHPYFDGFRTHLFVVILGVDQHGMPNMGASFKKKET